MCKQPLLHRARACTITAGTESAAITATTTTAASCARERASLVAAIAAINATASASAEPERGLLVRLQQPAGILPHLLRWWQLLPSRMGGLA